MNKKEILEIRKQFCMANANITRIEGCYVDGEKNKSVGISESFLSMPETEAFKYLDIFKKSLSGNIGKNLINIDIPLFDQLSGGIQKSLLELRDSKLSDAKLVDEFYDKVIESYDYNEHYYIIVAHGIYDIPGKTKDNLEMFDASDEVYEYILCCICPVKLSKAGLSYNITEHSVQARTRDWVVGEPSYSFLYPAFNERSQDLGSVLYSKKKDEMQEEFIGHLLSSKIPINPVREYELFWGMIHNILGKDADFKELLDIHVNLQASREMYDDASDLIYLGKNDLQKVLEESNISEEKIARLDSEYSYVESVLSVQPFEFLLSNICKTNCKIRTDFATITTKIYDLQNIFTRTIEGKEYICVPADQKSID